MNICFIANYTKTYFFHEIANFLITKDPDININWIIVNNENYSFLKARYAEKNLLYLSKQDILASNSAAIGEFKLNELIYGDRVLKHEYDMGLSYLSKMQKPVYDFIERSRIDFIFSESTWAHELLIHRLVLQKKELNCRFLEPHTVRIPAGRFAFFEDEFQSKMHIHDYQYAEKSYPKDAFIPKKPTYLALNDAILKKSNSLTGRLGRLKNYVTNKNIDANDITLLGLKNIKRTLLPIQNELNKESYKLVKTLSIEELRGKHFILATLHKQPEASIDVMGRYVEDQSINLINLWRQLPSDWLLVVKEHSNAVGDRSSKFYRNLLKYRNIVFVDEKADSHKLIDMCEAIFTITGTIAYEAALKNKKALVMTDLFFNFSYVKRINFQDLKTTSNLLEVLDQIPDTKVDDEQLKKMIFHNSFEGIISDPLSDINCIGPENIEKVASAILKLKK